MQRITITLDDALLREIDALGYGNRSEALRDLARAGLRELKDGAPAAGPCAAAFAYVYDHGRRDLPDRLAATFHGHHELSVATMHVHLDQERCMELAVLRGDAARVRTLADAISAERGVRHGRLLVVAQEGHDHGDDAPD